jgi:hypothetical protein
MGMDQLHTHLYVVAREGGVCVCSWRLRWRARIGFVNGLWGDHPWQNLDDGDDNTFAHSINSVECWMELDFGEQDCTKVVLKNRTAGGTPEVVNRLNGVRLQAMDKDHKPLWEYTFWGDISSFKPVYTFDFNGKML